jgi:signal transduction histidine kinase
MYFRFAARVIAQLGAELISSDEIAIYELVKNGFDAGAETVTVEVVYALDLAEIDRLQSLAKSLAAERPPAEVRETLGSELVRLAWQRGQIPDSVRPSEADVAGLVGELEQAATPIDFVRCLGRLNRIVVADAGHGMSKDSLAQNFLTIGTTFRYQQHRAYLDRGEAYPSTHAPSGEKGIGRLSAMRLGDDLGVHTWVRGDGKEHTLRIDWRKFSAEVDASANEIDVEYREAPRSHPADSSGTTLTITDLRSDWPKKKAEVEIAQGSLSHFIDPFGAEQSRQVRLWWNGEEITVPLVGRRFLEAAHNGMRGRLTLDEHGRFRLEIDYWFAASDPHPPHRISRVYTVADFDKITDQEVAEVGPFDFDLYHYNRKRLAAIPTVATRAEFKEWLDAWCGGLMLYRDGIRVMPYGQMPSDDWLGLDEMALRGKGFRVNRIQVVGCVRISRMRNPMLKDQTNREGLIDNPASRTFRNLLRRIIRELFVRELDGVSREDLDSAENLAARTAQVQTVFEAAADDLIRAAEDQDVAGFAIARVEVQRALEGLRRVNDDVEKALASRDLQKTELLELAATGMSAEALAHDLEANLDEAMNETAAIAGLPSLPQSLRSSIGHLGAVFKSLRVQLAAIKPGPAKQRRRRSTFDLHQLLRQVADFYSARMRRHGVSLLVESDRPGTPFRIKAVDGHVRQILDNLLRNSIYWLTDTRARFADSPEPEIFVRLDHASRCLLFADNGIGISPDDTEWVFEAFNTHREGGHGLGLYITRELAQFNAIRIEIDSRQPNRWGRFNRFVLDVSACFEGG